MESALPKQFMALDGRPMLERTLARLSACPTVDSLVVGVDTENAHWLALDDSRIKPLLTAAPGAERVDTVAGCLREICARKGEQDWALVHDAARPCVRVRDIERLIEEVRKQADGGILAVPLADTIKRADAQGWIEHTVPRARLWRAMTPQLFRVGPLLAAIGAALRDGVEVTDEASAMEYAGAQVRLVACSPDNIKVTLPEDVVFAERILRGQSEEQQLA